MKVLFALRAALTSSLTTPCPVVMKSPPTLLEFPALPKSDSSPQPGTKHVWASTNQSPRQVNERRWDLLIALMIQIEIVTATVS